MTQPIGFPELERVRSVENMFRSTGFEAVGISSSHEMKSENQRSQLGSEPENHISYKKEGGKAFITMHYQPEKHSSSQAQRTTDLLIELDEFNNIADVVLQVTQQGKVVLFKNSAQVEFNPQSNQDNYDFLAFTGANHLTDDVPSIKELLWIASNSALYQYALDHNIDPRRVISQANAIRQIDELDLRNKVSIPHMLAAFDTGAQIYHFNIAASSAYGKISIDRLSERNKRVQVEPSAVVTLELPENDLQVPTMVHFQMGGQFSQMPRQTWSAHITYNPQNDWVKKSTTEPTTVELSRADIDEYSVAVAQGDFASDLQRTAIINNAYWRLLMTKDEIRTFYHECRYIVEALFIRGEK